MMDYDTFIDRVEVLVATKCSAPEAWNMVDRASSAGVFNDAYDSESARTEAEATRIADYIIEQSARDTAFLFRSVVLCAAGGEHE